MGREQEAGREPVVITIRLSGRWMPFLGAASVLALLPALGPESTAAPRASMAAAPITVGEAPLWAPAADAAPEAVSDGVGGGPMLFPGLQLAAGGTGTANAVPTATPLQFALGLAGTPMASPSTAAGFIWPVHAPVMSRFGPRYHPVLGVPMFHTGLDLGATCGTPVLAAADGVVEYAATSSSWGNRIIVAHDSTLKTGYAHLSAFRVRAGESVRQGQVIGLVGTTGWSTGCHLHFDVIVNERYVDPSPYLGLTTDRTVSIPYTAAPHLVLDGSGKVVRTVEDGDVPIPPSSPGPTTSAPRSPSPSTTTPAPSTTKTGTPTGSTSSTTTTGTPSGTSTSTPTTTTSEPAPTTSTGTSTSTPSEPTTTTTTSEPTTTEPSTTSEPPATTSTGTTSTGTTSAGSGDGSATTSSEPTGTTSTGTSSGDGGGTTSGTASGSTSTTSGGTSSSTTSATTSTPSGTSSTSDGATASTSQATGSAPDPAASTTTAGGESPAGTDGTGSGTTSAP